MLSLWKKRSLRTHILAVFLTILTLSSLATLGFQRLRNTNAILRFAKQDLGRIDSYIQAQIRCLLRDFERLPQLAAPLYRLNPRIEPTNTALTTYLLQIVRSHPKLYALYVGAPNGSFLGVFNLPITGNSGYFGDHKPAPSGAVYALILLNRFSDQELEIWSYYDAELKLLHSEQVADRGYDPRLRPWYRGALAAQRLSWTDLFVYDPTGDPGIAVAEPVYEDSGELVGVIGADLSLGIFSSFLSDLKIGSVGRALLLNEKGRVILPYRSTDPDTLRAIELAPRIFERFQHTQSSDFIFRDRGRRHLAAVHPMPITFERNWFIVLTDPIADAFGPLLRTQNQALLISVIILALASLFILYFAHTIALPILALAREIRKIQHFDLSSQTRVTSDIAEIKAMDTSIDAMRSAIRSFSRYVPKEVVKTLVSNSHPIALGGDNKELVVFFSDITGFTSIAEPLSPEAITELLTDYFSILTGKILATQGTIDKYTGDGIMAFWGAPTPVAEPAAAACLTALSAQHEIALFNRRQQSKGAPILPTKMGIGLGQAMVGNIGTPDRMNYTALGDIVNTVARLQSLNQTYGTRIIVGQKAVQAAGPAFLFRPLDHVEIKGKREKFTIFELVGLLEGPPELCATTAQQQLCTEFTTAYETFHQGRQAQAHALFEKLHTAFPEDTPTLLYLRRFH
jgi:adenylate cyclase